MQTKNRFQWLTALLFPAILLYFEVLSQTFNGWMESFRLNYFYMIKLKVLHEIMQFTQVM